MRSWTQLAALAAVAVVVAQVLVRGAAPSFAPGEEAPSISLPDLQGHPVDLGALRGRVVAINFWATWCAPCQAEIPELARVWREQRGRCLEILGVAEESGSPAEVAEFARRHAIPYPVLLDPDGKAAESWRVPGYPRTYLVDAGGKVRQVFDGALRKRSLEEALEPLLMPPGSCPGT